MLKVVDELHSLVDDYHPGVDDYHPGVDDHHSLVDDLYDNDKTADWSSGPSMWSGGYSSTKEYGARGFLSLVGGCKKRCAIA